MKTSLHMVDREYGHIVTRMGMERKVIVGHWADKDSTGKTGILDAYRSRNHGEQPYPCMPCCR